MSKTAVTPELANTLKTLRLQNNIQSKNLASHIGKSSAYITKLEKGDIKNVDNEILDKILSFLAGEDIESDVLAEKIYAAQKPSKKDIEEQLWFVNYDTVLRRLPIPESLISFAHEKMTANNIERSVLLSRINSNEALTAEELSDETLEFNRWYCLRNDTSQSIKINLSEKDFNDILDRKKTFSSYIFVFSIIFYILKIEAFCNLVNIPPEENQKIMNNTTQVLTEHRFYSLAEKSKIIASAKTQEQANTLLNSFDTDNQKIISEILSGFKFASELDISTTNERLKKLCDNMHWDIWFMLKLLSFDFSSLAELSTSLRKELLNEIEDVVSKYNNLPSMQKKIESY